MLDGDARGQSAGMRYFVLAEHIVRQEIIWIVRSFFGPSCKYISAEAEPRIYLSHSGFPPAYWD